MAPTYVVSCPLVIIKDRAGVDQYFYRDVPVVGEFDPERLQTLAAEGLIEKAEAAAVPSDEPTMPAKSAGKPAWVSWAVQQGADPAKAGSANKPDLVAAFGPDGTDELRAEFAPESAGAGDES